MGDDVRRKALASLVAFAAVLAAFLFVPAGSLRFWEAWVYWALFIAWCLATTLHFLESDPALVARRMRAGPLAEREPRQQVIQTLTMLLMCAVFVVPGLEHRTHPDRLPVPVVLGADAVVVASFVGFFLVLRENTWAASTVEVAPDQRVVSTGPYALVRHPMYAAGMLLFLATPLALGSVWALGPAAALCGVVVARLLDEERYLSARLPGYAAYCERVRFRLIPSVW